VLQCNADVDKLVNQFDVKEIETSGWRQTTLFFKQFAEIMNKLKKSTIEDYAQLDTNLREISSLKQTALTQLRKAEGGEDPVRRYVLDNLSAIEVYLRRALVEKLAVSANPPTAFQIDSRTQNAVSSNFDASSTIISNRCQAQRLSTYFGIETTLSLQPT